MAIIPKPEKEDEKLRFKISTDYVDKLIVLFPTYDEFSLSNIIAEYNVNNDNKISKYRKEINKLLIEEFQYIDYSGNRIKNCSLTSIGRMAKESGGHFKYLESLEEEKLLENNELTEKKEIESQILEETLIINKLTIQQKKFENTIGRRYKKFGVIISIITLLLAILGSSIVNNPPKINSNKGFKTHVDSLNSLIIELDARIHLLENKSTVDTLIQK